MDIDSGCVEAPEDLPVFPDQVDLIQELSEVLLRFGLPPRGGAAPAPTAAAAASPRLSSLVLEDLMEDRRNGNLGGEELEVLERLQALARRCGGEKTSDGGKTLGHVLEKEEEEELKAAKLNIQLREVFAGRFTALFGRYEEFVIHSALDLDSWLSNREATFSFDKVLLMHRHIKLLSLSLRCVFGLLCDGPLIKLSMLSLCSSMFQGSFLSVQPGTHLHFLSRFLETSMFSSFVDGKVISRWAEREPLQQLFDSRLETQRLYDTDEEDSRNCRYRKCTTVFESGTVTMFITKTR